LSAVLLGNFGLHHVNAGALEFFANGFFFPVPLVALISRLLGSLALALRLVLRAALILHFLRVLGLQHSGSGDVVERVIQGVKVNAVLVGGLFKLDFEVLFSVFVFLNERGHRF
jgi:hypothetical protein